MPRRVRGRVLFMEQFKPKTRVLVVDDHVTFADSLATILNQDGCVAAAVYSGEQAIAAATDFRPDVLISDVIMDGLSGIDTAILIGRAFPDCEIVLVSGQLDTADLLERARRQGHIFEIMAKPVHPETILNRLNHLHPPAGNPVAPRTSNGFAH
jgi:CheY-like chemotaxis protein